MGNEDKPSLTFLMLTIIGVSYCVQNVCAEINRSHLNQNRNDNVADPTSSQLSRDTSSQSNEASDPDNSNSRHGNEEGLSGSDNVEVIYSVYNHDNMHQGETGRSDAGGRSLLHTRGVQTAAETFNEENDDRVLSNQASMPTTRASFLGDRAARIRQVLERRRDRERRVLNFRQTILRNTGFNRPPNMEISQRDRLAAMSRFGRRYPNWRPTRQTEEHCYKVTCSLPESTNTLLWSNESEPVLRLYFSVPRLNRRRIAQQKELDQARLKLFVKPKTDCPPCQDEDTDPRPLNYLTVTAYQFIRPLSYRKRNRIVYRRQILDVAIVSEEGNTWVDLDVKRAVNLWMTRSRKNFGLEIIVSYMNGTLLDAKSILSLPRCEDGVVRACRGDRGDSIERDFWSSLTLAEDTEPYIDVVTGTRAHVLFPSFNQSSLPLQLPRLRTTRSVSTPLTEKGNRSKTPQKIAQKFSLFKNSSKDFLKTLILQGGKSKNAKQNEQGSISKNVLEKVNVTTSQSHPEICSCHPKQESHPNGIEKLQREDSKSPNQDQKRITPGHVIPSPSEASKSEPTVSAPESCKGKRITVNIEDIRVVSPKSYTTLVCPNTCRVCSNGQCYHRNCKLARHRHLRAVVNMPSGGKKIQNLPGHKVITECGC